MSEIYLEGPPVLGASAVSTSTTVFVSESPWVIRRVIERVLEPHDDDSDDLDELTRILGL
jgi:hypothetical protein